MVSRGGFATRIWDKLVWVLLANRFSYLSDRVSGLFVSRQKRRGGLKFRVDIWPCGNLCARFLINFIRFGCIHLPPGERYINVLLVTHTNKWQELLPRYFKDENKISLLFKISKCTVNFKFLHIHDKNGRGLVSL